MAAGGGDARCRCVVTDIRENEPFDEFGQEATELEANPTSARPAVWLDAATMCASVPDLPTFP